MKLSAALRLSQPVRLALVGAGGKTSAMLCLGGELVETIRSVILTTTTHLGTWQLAHADSDWVLDKGEKIAERGEIPPGLVFITGQPGADQRVGSLTKAQWSELEYLIRTSGMPLLIEADGARKLPLKAPGRHEPPIPGFVEDVVVCAGMSALGQPLGTACVHRPERFAQLSGLEMGEEITPEALSRVLAHPDGGLKNIPSGARRSLLLTQADSVERQSQARSVAQQIQYAYNRVIIANISKLSEVVDPTRPADPVSAEIFAVHEPIAAIILAAGGAQRFGSPKQLAEWRGQPLVKHVAVTALAAGLNPVVVVTGAAARQVGQVLAGYPIRLVHNPEWQAGQSTSVRAGVSALSPDCGGAVFMLVDQPNIPTALIQTLIEEHSQSIAPIVAPMIDGQRGNPVLFDQVTFPELLSLTGDQGGRQLFSKHPIRYVPWYDRSVLLDVDTPQDLTRFEDEG